MIEARPGSLTRTHTLALTLTYLHFTQHTHTHTRTRGTHAVVSSAPGGNLILQAYPRFGSGSQFLRKVRACLLA